MKKLLLSICIFTLCCGLNAQNVAAKKEHISGLPNRLNLYIIEDSLAQDVTVGLTFNCGSFIEDNDFDGLSFLYEKILVEKFRQHLSSNVSQSVSDSSLFSIYSETSYEHIFLRVTTPKAQLSNVLQAMNESVTVAADSQQVMRAVYLSNAARQELNGNTLAKLDSALGSILWENNYSKRVFINAWNDSTAALLPDSLTRMSQQYFCPGNALLVIKGNVERREMEATAKKIFSRWAKCAYSLIGRFPGYNYRALLANSQLVVEDSLVSTPFYKIAFQGPNSFEGMKNNYSALVLSELLANPASRIHHFFKDSCRMASVKMQNEMVRFLSQLTFTALPESECLDESYACFRSFLSGANDSLIDSLEFAAGKEAVLSRFNKMKSDNSEHVFLIGKYWKSLSLDEYSDFKDSLSALTLADMQFFLDTCLYKRCSVAGLVISPQQRAEGDIDSFFTPTSTEIVSYRINFLKNSARFASEADDSVFNSLVQFLKLNTRIDVKVNGMCHQTELLDILDEEMLTWVRSYENFMMNPPSLVKKRKFRLDVYRSLTLIKKLVESGIDINRLFGTGNLVRAPEDPEKSQTANFSLTF